MSVINQMLRDLEARRAHGDAQERAAIAAMAAAAPPRRRPWRPWLWAALALLAAAGGLWWGLQRAAPPAEAVAAAPAPAAPEAQAPKAPKAPKAPPAEVPPAAPAGPAAPPEVEVPARPRLLGLHSSADARRLQLTLELSAPLAAMPRIDAARGRIDLGALDWPPALGLPAVAGSPLDALDLEVDAAGARLIYAPADAVVVQLDTQAARLQLEFRSRRAPASPAPAAAEAAPKARPAPRPPAPSPAVTKSARAPSPAERAEAAYGQALEALRAGDTARAERRLRAALADDPALRAASLALGGLLLQAGRAAEAAGVLAAGQAHHPRDPDLARLRARALLAGGDVEGAIAVMERVGQAGAGDARFLGLLAALYQRRPDHERAAAFYRAALRLEPGNGPWWAGLAISLEALGRPAEAQEAYGRAQRLGALDAALARYVESRLKALQ